MALKGYDELVKLDVSEYIEKRDKMDYLNWARVVDLLHKHGAEIVYFEPLVNENGSSLFMTERVYGDQDKTHQCYEVGVKVVVDDKVWEFRGPLMNGTNPVKDNSISQQRIWNCQTRLFVKCIAIHTGLGFNLWLKEEQENEKSDKWDDINNHSIMAVKERVQRLVTEKMDKGLTVSDIAAAMNRDEKEVSMLFNYYKILDNFEKAVQKL